MRAYAPILLLAALIFLNGCGKEDIRVYTVDKEETAQPAFVTPPDSSMRNQTLPPDALGSAGTPAWTVPEGWAQGPTSSIRRGSYQVTQEGQTLDISVTTFPGDVGGLLANVNRWRGQVGLPPVEEAALPEMTREEAISGHSVTWVELNGPELATQAAIHFHADHSWFFKMTGPQGLVTQEADRFRAFVESVQF